MLIGGLRYVHTELKDSAIVVNQDTVLPPLEHFRKICGEGVVSPQQITLQGASPFTSWDEYNKQIPDSLERHEHFKVTGFCIFLSKALMDKAGYLDEYFVAGFDDDDLCARALLAGFPVETVNIPVHHYVSKAGSNYQHKLPLNEMKFRNKWTIPLDIAHSQFNEWIKTNHSWNDHMRVE